MSTSVVLPFPLRKYQQEAVTLLLTHRHGTVVLPTATGKTAIAIGCMQRLKLRTAILVHTEALLKQWIDKLREAKVFATAFYGKEKHVSSVTVFILNSALLHPGLLSRYQFIIIDECLPYDVLVTLEDGRRLPIGKIVEEKLTVKVLSFNTATKKVEAKKITHFFKLRQRHPLVTVNHEFGSLPITENNEIFTVNRGYVPAKCLTTLDQMMYLHELQVQVVSPCNLFHALQT